MNTAALLLLPLLAAPPPSKTTLDVDAAVTRALVQNPRVAAAERAAQAAGATIDAVGAWPEPTLRLTASPLPIETRNGPAWASAALAWPLPWTGELDAATEGAAAMAEAARQRAAEVRLAVAREVRLACAALRLVEAERAINEHTTDILKRFVDLAQTRLAVGRGTQNDVLMAQVELARLENQAIDLAQQRTTRAAAVNLALGQPPSTPVPPVAPAATPAAEALDELLAWMRAHHPTLARFDADIAARRAALRQANYAGVPRFDVGLAYTYVAEPDKPAGADPGRDALAVTAGVRLPLWGDSYDARADAAAHAVGAEEAKRQDAEQMAAYQVIENHVRAETALRQARLLDGTVLPLARQSVAVLEEAYAADRAGFLQLLDAERALERFELEHARARAALEARLADLQHAVGRPPKEGGAE
ncbi:MAG: TolC family protein [Myxococcales bacterium]|nr:TolC family protein [Myxococcales bacterium]